MVIPKDPLQIKQTGSGQTRRYSGNFAIIVLKDSLQIKWFCHGHTKRYTINFVMFIIKDSLQKNCSAMVVL